MKYETIVKPKEKRMVETCRMDEAFRLDKSWYIRVDINDGEIKNYDDFFEIHAISDNFRGNTHDDYVPVMHLGAQSFCYVYSHQVADEWADLKLSLLVK